MEGSAWRSECTYTLTIERASQSDGDGGELTSLFKVFPIQLFFDVVFSQFITLSSLLFKKCIFTGKGKLDP